MRPGDVKSILILPFQNYTGDEQLDAIISGMHAALIIDVGRIITVKSKTTSDAYKDTDMTLSQIASEVGVDVIIESGITSAGDTICVQSVMNTPDEEQLWVAEYSEAKSQIPNIHNRITKQIADELMIELTTKQVSLLSESRTVDPEAIDAYLKGQAEVVGYQNQMRFIQSSLAIPKIYDNLNRALELDPNSSNAHYIKALIAVWTEWNWERGEEEFIKSLDLNPSNAMCRMFYAHLLGILHRSDEAIYQANLAMKLDPYRPFILGLYAAFMGQMGDYQSAIDYGEKALSIDPNHWFIIYQISGAYRKIGDYEKFFEYFKKIAGYDDKVLASIDSVFHEQGYFAAVEMTIKIDEEAANERYIDIVTLGFRYIEIGNYDKAMDYYEKGYEIRLPNMPYITTKMFGYDQLKENPRYIALLKKMNLPLPED